MRGGNPASTSWARRLTVRGLQVDGANFGLHIDDNAVTDARDVALSASTGVGLLLQQGGTIDRARHARAPTRVARASPPSTGQGQSNAA
ncbi:MAG: hypothetical protein U0531_01740 [Dehalococcoidia bacterium]